ncbi:hypothetical protein CPter291_2518 [Collimonas pratensis]|uniref:Uncharacterized protein n=2 Tax=Collimonas pratensis TaxID=279113 RepID=A0ABN4M930_9BURK|nr:hypothetical protein CPter291_2518 [Collimonas pratensis]
MLLCFTSHVHSQTTLPDLGEPYDIDVPFNNIAGSLLTGDIRTFTNQIGEKVSFYIKNNPASITKLGWEQVQNVSGKLNEILNNPGLDSNQKNDAVNKAVDDSVLPYESQAIGALSATYRYSLDYGIARLSYNILSKNSYCGQSIYVGTNNTRYERWYAVKVPQISVYRVAADRSEKLITSMASKDYPYSDQWELSFTQAGLAKSVWEALSVYYRLKRQGDLYARSSIDLPTELYLQPNSSLSYRIEASYPGLARCDPGTSGRAASVEQSIVTISTDGNGKVDIIPSEIYDPYLANINGPKIIPVLNMLLSD